MIEQASLVIGADCKWAVKSDSLLGYKINNGKYYKRDLSVVRATTGTRVNSEGLIESVPYNLVSYSEEFENTAWIKVESSITANTTISPNGLINADSFISNGVATQHAIYYQSSSGLSRTISIYAKYGTHQFLQILTGGSANPVANYDLINGTSNMVGSLSTASIINVGNGWYRCILSSTDTTATNIYFAFADSLTSSRFPSVLSSGTIFLWGAQLVEGSTPKDYFPTTTRLNIPRLDYSQGGCPSLLVEPQRTNFLIYSEELIVGKAFNGAGGGFMVTQNTTETLDPSGNYNSDKFTTTGTNYNDSYVSTLGSGNMTLSIFAKKGTSSIINLLEFNVTTGVNCSATFDLNNGMVQSTSGTILASAIEDFGNGWYRCSISGQDSLSSGNIHRISTYTGTTYLFGLQGEQGSYATSYIPTTSTTVTRNADIVSKTEISDLIGQTEGTLFVDFNYFALISAPSTLEVVPLEIGNGTVNNKMYLSVYQGDLYIVIFTEGAIQSLINIGTLTQGRHKVGISYIANDVRAFLDGSFIISDTSVTLPTLSNIYIGSLSNVGAESHSINEVALWKTRLTNTQLAQLTTL